MRETNALGKRQGLSYFERNSSGCHLAANLYYDAVLPLLLVGNVMNN